MDIFQEDDEELSEYEKLRLRNVEENKKQMALLFCDEKEKLAKDSNVPKNKPKKIKRRSARINYGYATRRSERINKCFCNWRSKKLLPKHTCKTKEDCEKNKCIRKILFASSDDEDGEWNDSNEWKGWDNRYHSLRDMTRAWKSPTVRRCRQQGQVAMAQTEPKDITEDDLNNVAETNCQKTRCQGEERGSTCHQCRQKTLDMKTICRSGICVGLRGQFCGVCLKNRYGECAKAALMDPNWSCPPCRGICNCSICRNRKGLKPTGILFPRVRACGYNSVHEILQEADKEDDN